MARVALLIAVVLMVTIFSAGSSGHSNPENEGPIVIEWFVDNSDGDATEIEDNLSHLRYDPGVLWLSWHPGVMVTNDPVGNHDGSVRAEKMGVEKLPAFRTELNSLEGREDGNTTEIESQLEEYVINKSIERLAEITLKLQINDGDVRDGYDELVVQAQVTPSTNLSDETVLYFMIVEWSHASDESTHRPVNVVREMMPRSGLPRTAGESGMVEFIFDAKYLDPANITIEPEHADHWGVVAMLSGHDIGSDSPRSAQPGENETILATAVASVPTRWQLATLEDGVPWIIGTVVIIAAMAMVIHAERRREMELPKVSGKLLPAPSAGNQTRYKVAIDIKAGSLPAELIKVDTSPPWKIRRAPKRQMLAPGSESSWQLDVRAGEEMGHRGVNVHVSFTVEGAGDGWVMDLRLKPPRDNEEE
ncbi:MAG TPA: hypothetical protein EYN88_04895 [Candidatus Poseidoniales archaeon]|nr:hypothetical protein [Candidatus Poseidoniales archaeon]HIA90260.1 hypothetical protein [Candidatus Poseidoniales archaeon]HIB59312.1 hypothetical protein [Candidatus Poseidoniales archaeon]